MKTGEAAPPIAGNHASMTRGTVLGFDSIVLETARIRVVIIPALGGRVWEFTDRLRERQWIWHREDVPLTASPVGSSYDDVWAGGWEELFPNDAPGTFEGRLLHDHGSWWATPWTVTEVSAGPEAVVRLTAELRSPDARCVKEFRLGSESNALRVSYEIESREQEPFHFLFKQHLPIAVTAHCTLRLPGGTVTQVDPSFGTLLTTAAPFPWPAAPRDDGGTTDLTMVPEPSNTAREFVYVADLPESWCGVDDAEASASLRMDYDGAQMPFVWLFLSYGGWRGCYTAVLEPCTNMPKDLSTALRLGQSARLSPGGVFRTQVAVSLGGLVTGPATGDR